MRQRMLLGNPNMKQSASAQEEAAGAEERKQLAKTVVESPAIRDMVAMITDNTEFLQDAQLQRLLQTLPRDKASMLAMKSVLSALGIKSTQDAQLLQLFLSSDAQQATPEQMQ